MLFLYRMKNFFFHIESLIIYYRYIQKKNNFIPLFICKKKKTKIINSIFSQNNRFRNNIYLAICKVNNKMFLY